MVDNPLQKMSLNSTQFCRLCLETVADLVNICEKFQDSTIASVLAEHFWFQDDKTDGMLEWVCEVCWNQTKTFHLFFKSVELRQQNSWRLKNVASAASADEIQITRSVSTIAEAENIIECDEDTASETDDIHLVAEEESDEDNNDRSSDENKTRPTSNDEHQLSSIQKLKHEEVTGKKQKRPIQRHTPAEIDAELRLYFRMKCEICSDVELDTLKNVRKHYRQVHKTSGYLICCGAQYTKTSLMLDHIQYHVNPDANRCDQCGKRFGNGAILRSHIKTHGREWLERRDYKCSRCSKTYLDATALKYHVEHTHSTDPSTKFTCNLCGKVYPTKVSLTSHTKWVHEFTRGNVCEVCGRTFKTKTDLQYHIQVIHSTTPLPKFQCDICGSCLKSKPSVRRHLKLHQEMQEVRCSICNKKLKTKYSLRSHMQFCHGERKHQCTVCSKAFTTSKILKEHIAFHTGEDLYRCSYCDRTFKSNANMYSHRKKAHLAELTRDKIAYKSAESETI